MTPVASTTVTVIHNAGHATVTSVPAGTTVHDQATVTGGLGDADGDGDVRLVHQRHLHRAGGGDVEPVHAGAAGSRTGDVHADAADASGSFAFQATYSGDATYTASTGPCEPLTVTPVASTTVTVIHDAAMRR